MSKKEGKKDSKRKRGRGQDYEEFRKGEEVKIKKWERRRKGIDLLQDEMGEKEGKKDNIKKEHKNRTERKNIRKDIITKD